MKQQIKHHPCSVFFDVYSVLFLLYMNTCVCVCHQFHCPWRECHRARRFQATLLLHTTCVRSWCKWRASCVTANTKKKDFFHKTFGFYSIKQTNFVTIYGTNIFPTRKTGILRSQQSNPSCMLGKRPQKNPANGWHSSFLLSKN